LESANLLLVISVKPKNRSKKLKMNMSAFYFLNNRSTDVVWKAETFKNRKTEPNCRFKSNAQVVPEAEEESGFSGDE
jgi:hypothetical protein